GWRGGLWLGREREELPAEEAGDGAWAKESRDAAVDASGVGAAAITASYDLGDAFQAGADFGDAALALFLADFLIGAAEDKEDAAGNALVGVRGEDRMAEGGEIVMLLGQPRVGLATALLLDGEEAGALPGEALALLAEEGLELMPGDRAQDVVAGVVQAGDMAGGVGAAVGDQEQRIGMEVVLQELALLGDGRVVVVVAADGVAEERHGALVIDDGAQAGVDQLGVDGEVAVGDVGGGKVGGGSARRQRQVIGMRLGGLIDAVKE